jgi:hypothetical protein
MGFELSPAVVDVPADTQVNIEGAHDFIVYQMVENKPVRIIGRSAERKAKVKIRQDMQISIESVDGSFLSYDGFPIPSVYDPADPIPFEVPDENRGHLTLEEKLKAYLAEMVRDRYGAESEEMDTFEDAQDFLIPDDEDILTGYEVQDMEPLEADLPPDPPPQTTPPQEEQPAPQEPENPPAEDPPA